MSVKNMNFDVDQDFAIFKPLFERRPELSPDRLRQDLIRYYLPYIKKLVDLKKQKLGTTGVLTGVSAIQGAGKTTQGEILEILLKFLGFSSVSRSIDDDYITHQELCELREKDRRFIRRGVTHDIPLALRVLQGLQNMAPGNSVLVSGYDKGAHQGDGDRFRWINLDPGLEMKAQVIKEQLVVNKNLQTVLALHLISASYLDRKLVLPENMGSDIPLVEYFLPNYLLTFLSSQEGQEIIIKNDGLDSVQFTGSSELPVLAKDLPNGWRLITQKPDFIFYDGWMLGAKSVEDESVFSPSLPALETPEARQFAKDVNKKLLDYEPLWEKLEFVNVLYVPHYQDSLKWRDRAEEALRAKGEGMSYNEIREFVYYFWRSVHPAIHIKNLAHDSVHTQQVVIINDDHSIGEILSPPEVKIKYP